MAVAVVFSYFKPISCFFRVEAYSCIWINFFITIDTPCLVMTRYSLSKSIFSQRNIRIFHHNELRETITTLRAHCDKALDALEHISVELNIERGERDNALTELNDAWSPKSMDGFNQCTSHERSSLALL